MKLRRVFYVSCLLAPAVLFSCTKNNDDNLNTQDQTFLTQASISNSAEIQAGTLAASKGNSTLVKNFGTMMVAEYTTTQSDLKKTGSNVGVTVKDAVDPAHVVIMQQLNGLNRACICSVYIKTQLSDHQMTQTMFQAEINNGSHSQIKNYANTYLPHIQMHLTSADSIATAMKFK